MIKNNSDLQIKQVAAGVLGVPVQKLTDETSQQTIPSWDSLTHLKLVMELEKEFNIAFNTEEVFAIDTIGKICESVKKHIR